MLPDEEETGVLLSTKVIKGTFLVPLRNTALYDYEWGGVDINDVSKGLFYKLWRLKYNAATKEMILKRSDRPESIVVLEDLEEVTSIGLAFDFNMNPQVVYVITGVTYLYWYDTSEATYVTTTIPDAKNPCMSLDDSRDIAASKNDVILAYQKESDLYFRMQRDMYQVEYLLSDNVDANMRLHQVGMTNKNRFQFLFKSI